MPASLRLEAPRNIFRTVGGFGTLGAEGPAKWVGQALSHSLGEISKP
jgi:hypothetical protein